MEQQFTSNKNGCQLQRFSGYYIIIIFNAVQNEIKVSLHAELHLS